jgi:putative transposase
MSVKRLTRKTAPSDWLKTEQWTKASQESLTDLEKCKMNALTSAIQDYAAGKPISSFLDLNNISWETFHRAFNRCLAQDQFGRQVGWRGLLPNVRVVTPMRHKPLKQCGRGGRGGLAGSLQLLFSMLPAIKIEYDAYLYANAKRRLTNESKLRHKSAHQKFVALCKEHGVLENQWPLNTQKLGKGAIYLYVKNFLRSHYDDIVATQYGQKAKAKSATGKGIPSRLTASRTLDIIELDEHRCHFFGAIGVDTANGVRWLTLPRLVLILAADRKLTTILGYKVIFDREADAEDVLEVLHIVSAGGPSHIYSNDKYQQKTKGGFPRAVASLFKACSFNQLLLDNALAHLALSVITRARDILGCDINYGPVAKFERRPNVEGVFSALERAGFHRLASTTGTGPQDPIRQNAEQAAVTQRFSMNEVLDLIDAIIADHNGKIGKRNFGYGSLRQLDDLVTDVDGFGMIFPELPELPIYVAPLNVNVVELTIRGNYSKGRRPHIYYQEEEYFGEDIADRWDLLDEPLVVAHIKREDIRIIELFTKAGVRLGTVTVRGRWRHSPHSADLRRIINKIIRDGQLRVEYDEDPVHIHLEQITERLAQPSPKADQIASQAATMCAKRAQVQTKASADLVDKALQKARADNPIVDFEGQEDEEPNQTYDLFAVNGCLE